MSKQVEFLVGSISFQTNKSIEEIGTEISDKLFAGVPFGGIDEYIYEEIPAVYIKNPILGLQIVLSGYSGFDDDKWFVLHVSPHPTCTKDNSIIFDKHRIDNLLRMLIEYIPDILVKDE